MLAEVLAATIEKIASVGIATKVSVGVVAAVVGVSGAAAADVLPAGSQDAVVGVIQATTPFDVPDSADETDAEPAPVPATPAEDVTEPTDDDTEEPTDDASEEAPETPGDGATEPAKETFGTIVSQDARAGGVDGQEISAAARAAHQPVQARGPERSAKPEAPVVEEPAPAEPTDDRAAATPSTSPEAVATEPAEPVQPGNTQSNGPGKGNSVR